MQTLLSPRVDEVVIAAAWGAGLKTLPSAGYHRSDYPDSESLSALKQGMDAVVAQLPSGGQKGGVD
ncbi:hypothetical protein [Candidatus Pantoea persica]|uniref:hypothetical protein n=1 Tax=Candidatus Pantoea persica TaxID=2518128 RepID=UPI00215D7929|nr:hypothetical protein [Candidatus Pantoea persica]MBA2815427.1 acyltransferase [Candidatus Pantoea persica]